MKRLVLISMILSAMAVMVGMVSAQDDPTRSEVRSGLIREVLQATSAEIGLPVSDILVQMQPEGATLADVIEANGGSVDAVVTASVASATDRINQAVVDGNATQEQADKLLTNLDQFITDGINGDLPFTGDANPRRNMSRILILAIADETGLDADEVIQQVTIANNFEEVIAANGGSVENVIASAIAMVTERINEGVANDRLTQEQADDLLASLEQSFTDILNGEFERPNGDGERGRPSERRVALGVLRQIVEETGLTIRDIMPLLRDGATPAEILTDNGVDVDTFIDGLLVTVETRLAEAVESNRLTQDQADERLDTMRTTLTDRLNNPLDMPERDSDT